MAIDFAATSDLWSRGLYFPQEGQSSIAKEEKIQYKKSFPVVICNPSGKFNLALRMSRIGFTQLAEALYAYGRGNDRQGLELLGPDFDANSCKMIGASDEQLDVFNEVWYTMLLNAGEAMKAIEVIEKRIKKREGVPFIWRLLERGYKLANKPEAGIANEKARALESAYF